MAYQPRMTDPVSGKKLVKGRPVPAANAAPPSDKGRVKDPVSGDFMRKGKPVPNAYSGQLNEKVGLNLGAAGNALKAGFKPPDAGDKMEQGFNSVRQVGDQPKGGK